MNLPACLSLECSLGAPLRVWWAPSCSLGPRAINVAEACFLGHTWARGQGSWGSLWSRHSNSPSRLPALGSHLPALPAHQGPGAMAVSTTDRYLQPAGSHCVSWGRVTHQWWFQRVALGGPGWQPLICGNNSWPGSAGPGVLGFLVLFAKRPTLCPQNALSGTQ